MIRTKKKETKAILFFNGFMILLMFVMFITGVLSKVNFYFITIIFVSLIIILISLLNINKINKWMLWHWDDITFVAWLCVSGYLFLKARGV